MNIFKGLNNLKHFETKDPAEFVTVIIPFRNEKNNILNNLRSIEAQDYPENRFEVIYVNDFSTDDSPEILKKCITKNNIRVITSDTAIKDFHGKKQAIISGINKSNGEIIATTDADCTLPKEWLKTLLSSFSKNTAFVSGPVEFKSGKWFENLQRIEFAGLVFSGAGLIGYGTPTICNGANLAYRKNVFFEVEGFKHANHLSSGDDEILMQKIAGMTKYEIEFCIDPKALVSTNGNPTFKDFINQRKRWASKGLYYGSKLLILKLFLIFLFYVSLIVNLLLIPFHASFVTIFAASFFFKLLFEFSVLFNASHIMKYKIDFKYFLIAEIFHIPYIVFSSISGTIGKFSWKDRHLQR